MVEKICESELDSELTSRYGHPDKRAARSPLNSRTQSRLVRCRLWRPTPAASVSCRFLLWP